MPDKHTKPIHIAVVGHTNTGKTSLLRTLSKDRDFGEVSSRPSTTRHVEGVRLMVHGEVLVELYDTPGMEDPIALLEAIEGIASEEHERLDGPARISRFLTTPAASTRFEQEAKVLRQLLASDAAFYIIDVRDPLLAKHRDELTVLGNCAVPLLPVFNFVRDPAANEDVWREALARLGLHAVVRFDTVAPEKGGEETLYATLATLLYPHRATLQRLIASHAEDARLRHVSALQLIAELLIDVASCRKQVSHAETRLQDAVNELNERVKIHEQRCVTSLLELYRFDSDDIHAAQLPLIDGRWQDDLFNPETLRIVGIQIGSGAAAGAATGVGIDLMVGGITLGAAAALGALLGGGWQALRHHGGRWLGKLTGRIELSINDGILRLLALRQLHLLSALESRGHAALLPIHQFIAQEDELRAGKLPPSLRRARAHPEWSSLYTDSVTDSARHIAIETLARELESD